MPNSYPASRSQQAQYLWRPGPGQAFEEWTPGFHLITFTWNTVTGLPDTGELRFSFRCSDATWLFAIRLIAVSWLFAIRLIAMRPGSLPRPPKPPASQGGSRPQQGSRALSPYGSSLLHGSSPYGSSLCGRVPTQAAEAPSVARGSRPHARLFAIRLFAIRLIAMRPGSLPRPPKAGISPGSRLQLGRTAGPYLRPLWPAALQVQASAR